VDITDPLSRSEGRMSIRLVTILMLSPDFVSCYNTGLFQGLRNLVYLTLLIVVTA